MLLDCRLVSVKPEVIVYSMENKIDAEMMDRESWNVLIMIFKGESNGKLSMTNNVRLLVSSSLFCIG